MTKIGWLSAGVVLAGLAGGAAAQQSAVVPATTTADFCARLAADSGIDRPAATNGRTEWTADAANFGQRFIFGGLVATSVAVAPVEPASLDDYKRLKTMCETTGKGAICRLVGPVDFELGWKGRKINTPMTVGERATVTVVNTKTTCRTEAGS